MLDPKHKNIGATVSMINIIAQREADEISENSKASIGAMLAKAVLGDVDKLFMAESSECDWQSPNKQCLFNSDPEHYQLHTGLAPCRIGNCPLGALVDKELKNTGSLEFGCDPDKNMDVGVDAWPMDHRIPGGHIHIGYTGWRKHWDKLKKRVRGWFS
jgi:hypothetical protein